MAEISEIPIEELEQDKAEAMADAKFCGIALSYDVETVNGQSVTERLLANMEVVKVIDAEIERRRAVG